MSTQNLLGGMICEYGKTQICPRKVLGSLGMLVGLSTIFIPFVDDSVVNTVIIASSSLLGLTTFDKFKKGDCNG
jgi:hypothetical protein